MSRHATAESLSSYLDREMDVDELRRIERHLEECVDCRQRLEGLQRVVRGLGELERTAPPESLALRLQGRLAHTTPPFGRTGKGYRMPRAFFHTATLASLGVVLALAVITLLFLYALERHQAEVPPPAPPAIETMGETTIVFIGDRSFRPIEGGWAEIDLSPEAIAAAPSQPRPSLDSAPQHLRPILDRLEGDVVLLLEGSAVRLVAPGGGAPGD